MGVFVYDFPITACIIYTIKTNTSDFTFLCFLDLVMLFGFHAFGLVIRDKSVSKLFIHSRNKWDTYLL